MTAFRSQNGFPASPTKSDLHIVPLVVNGVEFVGGVLAGDVHDVLEHVWTQMDRRVERLRSPGCWGWAFRPNRNNPLKLSNHSSATATDGNAPAHPNGIEARHNFSAAQIAEVHQILTEIDELDEVVHWGGDWHFANGLTPDPMHMEIHDDDRAKLARVADRIRAHNQEDDMTPKQEKLLEQMAADAAAGRKAAERGQDFARRALARGQVITRLVIAGQGKSDESFDQVLAEIDELDQADAAAQP